MLENESRAEQRLPMVGHGVTSAGLERQIEAGQSLVAHAEEFLYTVFREPVPMRCLRLQRSGAPWSG